MSKLSIRRIRDGEIPEFRELAISEIGTDYPDIDESFALNIVRAHQNETDPIGYFTLTKTIWAGVLDETTIGYLVGTEKRGRSVKFSPILIKERHREQGYGTELWRTVEEHYRNEGHRKVYTHAPLYRGWLYRWITSLGYSLEGILAEQYDEGQHEFVMGKFLESPPTEVLDLPKPPSFEDGSDADCTIRRFEESDSDNFLQLIEEHMKPFYDGLSDDFGERIIDARERFDQGYKAKGKAIFIAESSDRLVGCCVGSPKRGGSVKLVPLLFTEEATRRMVHELIDSVSEYFAEVGQRKVYSMIPHLQTELLEVLIDNGFDAEGFLRAPYKRGIDNVFLGKFLEEPWV